MQFAQMARVLFMDKQAAIANSNKMLSLLAVDNMILDDEESDYDREADVDNGGDNDDYGSYSRTLVVMEVEATVVPNEFNVGTSQCHFAVHPIINQEAIAKTAAGIRCVVSLGLKATAKELLSYRLSGE